MGWTRGLVVVVVACAVCALPAQAGRADTGGADIASAPELPLGHQVSGGATKDARGYYQEFWAVTSVNGDTLDLTVSSTSDAGVVVCLYTPAVNDVSLPDAECHQSATIAGQGLQTFTFDLTSPGRWTLAFHGTDASKPFVYAATGRVEHQVSPPRAATRTVLRISARARRGARVAILGSVNIGSTGRVRVQDRPASRRRWTTIASMPLTANSQFAVATRFPNLGIYVVRAAYLGDAHHLPSAATRTIRIVAS